MKNKKILKILGVLALIITLIGGFIAYKRHESREKYYALYRHGFQLLEEQIAYYIVENYSGVSKVEFSPIFISGGGTNTFLNLWVVTRIYDNSGNDVILAGHYDKTYYTAFGTAGPLSVDMDIFGNHIIELDSSLHGEKIDVSNYEHLPEEGKLSSNTLIDQMIEWNNTNSTLINVKKDKSGSPEAKIVYNLEIKKGDWETWR